MYFTDTVPFFRELLRKHHLLGADDRSFRRWCSDGQETRNVCLSDQTLSFSSPTMMRTDTWIRRKKKKHSAAICHCEKTAEEAWRRTKSPACKAHPPVLINGSRSVKGRDNKDFLFHGENTMSCIHVHEKATTEQPVHSLLPWPAAGVCVHACH